MYSLVGFGFTKYANDLSGRTRMPKLNQGQLFRYQFPYPSTETQQAIVQHLDSLQQQLPSLAAAQTQVSSEIEGMIPALLGKFFEGEELCD
jgi:restriction endonuclease S subunit